MLYCHVLNSFGSEVISIKKLAVLQAESILKFMVVKHLGIRAMKFP